METLGRRLYPLRECKSTEADGQKTQHDCAHASPKCLEDKEGD